MGIVNVTPDSFSDGGAFLDPDAAIEHGLDLVTQGANLLDIGGESTRPGAEPVSEVEELRRVIPVIEGLVAAGTIAQISIVTDSAPPSTSPSRSRSSSSSSRSSPSSWSFPASSSSLSSCGRAGIESVIARST